MKKYLFITIFLSGYLFLTMQSCTSDELPEPTAPLCSTTVAVTYDTDIKAIIDKYCAYSGCHVSGFPSGDYSTYEGLEGFTASGSFKDRVVTQKNMPPSYAPDEELKSLDDDELQLIECWIEGGYLEN